MIFIEEERTYATETTHSQECGPSRIELPKAEGSKAHFREIYSSTHILMDPKLSTLKEMHQN